MMSIECPWLNLHIAYQVLNGPKLKWSKFKIYSKGKSIKYDFWQMCSIEQIFKTIAINLIQLIQFEIDKISIHLMISIFDIQLSSFE